MRASEFAQLVDSEFGPAHGRALIRDHVLAELGSRTPQQAIDAGVDLRDVWMALCRDLEVPPHRWWGSDGQQPDHRRSAGRRAIGS